MLIHKIPDKGLKEEDLFQIMDESIKSDIDWKSGKAFGAVYYPGENYSNVISKAFNRFVHENAFDPKLFNSILSMENELVGQTSSKPLIFCVFSIKFGI